MSNYLRITLQANIQFWIILYVIQYGVVAFDFLDKPGFYNFIVAVKTEAGICTGSIINKDWILTAAHCLYQDGHIVAGDDVTIMAGITNYEWPQEETGQFRSSAEIKVHPSFWNKRLAKFDLALVRVNDSFKFNDWVGDIRVAGDEWPINEEVENNCLSIGFGGYFGNRSPEKRLKIWNVTAAYGGDKCPCSRRFQYKRLVCAKNQDFAKLCKGDDGGPLICGNVVRGIAHMIRNWYQCSEDPTYPLKDCIGSPERGLSIYMLLCPFNDWMHKIVDDIPPTPLKCSTPVATSSIVVVASLLLLHLIYHKM